MDDELNRLDRELADLGAQWRAEQPAPAVPKSIAATSSGPQRWWFGVAAAAVVVGAVVLGSISLAPDGKEEPAPADTGPDVTNFLDCAEPAVDSVPGKTVVPQGVVAVRICGRVANPRGFDSVWPVETLTGSAAEELAAALNALEPASPRTDGGGNTERSERCPPSTNYSLVLRYPNGTRTWVRGGNQDDCERLTAPDGEQWTGATRISTLALTLIDQQRATRGPRPAPIPPQCPVDWRNLGGTVGADPIDASTPVAITACQYRLAGKERSFSSPRLAGRLDLQALVNQPDTLLRDVLAGEPTDPCSGQDFDLDGVQRVLYVRDAFGDLSVVPTEPCWPNTVAGRTQYPSGVLADRVASLFAAPTTE